MASLDRRFAHYRAAALRQPLTRAARLTIPGLILPGGIAIALSVNK
jgi:hypothetical protein